MKPLFLLPLAAVLFTACLGSSGEPPAAAPSPGPVIVEDLGDGVYYFPATGDRYRAALRSFLRDRAANHPEERCRYFGADESNLGTSGHTVVCSPGGLYAQDENPL